MKIKGVFILMSILFLTSCSSHEEDRVYTGTIECEEVEVSSEQSGEILHNFVEEGDHVKKGDILCEIDSKDLEFELSKAQILLRIAQARMDQLESGARIEEIKKAETQISKLEKLLNAKETDYEYQHANYGRLNTLYENGTVSKKELDLAKVALDQSKSSLESNKKDIESARYTLDLILKGAKDEERKVSYLEIEQSKNTIEKIKHDLSKSKIRAPISGRIENFNYDEGEQIPVLGSVANILDLNHYFIKIYVEQKYLNQINLNQEVRIKADFMRDKNIKGEIIHIAQEGEFTPKNTESKENKQEIVFEVKIKVLEKMAQLKPGMLVDVDLGSVENE